MKKNRNEKISEKTQQEAMAIAKGTQRPGQTKEQTRLIALGIQKGIAEYKKNVKNKQRQADKEKSRQQKAKKQAAMKAQKETSTPVKEVEKPQKNTAILPWTLFILSWIGFAAYYLFKFNL